MKKPTIPVEAMTTDDMRPISYVASLLAPHERKAFYERSEIHFLARDSPIPVVVKRILDLQAKPRTKHSTALIRIAILFLRRRGLGALPIDPISG